jgi:6-phosphogluconate dehydrogenase
MTNKELVVIGLGRMGMAMSQQLVEKGFSVHGYDASKEVRDTATSYGIKTSNSIKEAIQSMTGRKIVWLMVPSKQVDRVLDQIYPELHKGDIIIDGGNSFFKDTQIRAETAAYKHIHYFDCGTSGGVTGARNGASLMVGGNKEIFSEIELLFTSLATTNGYALVGEVGTGHFTKMVHNGIEYGMMGAIAEGMSFIEDHAEDLGIDTQSVLAPYAHGSIISSNLMNWMSEVYSNESHLNQISGEVPLGETESEMEYIATHNVTPVLQAALNQRKQTRQNPSRTGALISALRNAFGGHATKSK